MLDKSKFDDVIKISTLWVMVVTVHLAGAVLFVGVLVG